MHTGWFVTALKPNTEILNRHDLSEDHVLRLRKPNMIVQLDLQYRGEKPCPVRSGISLFCLSYDGISYKQVKTWKISWVTEVYIF